MFGKAQIMLYVHVLHSFCLFFKGYGITYEKGLTAKYPFD